MGSFDSRTLANVTNGTDGTYTYPVDVEEIQYSTIQTTINGGSGTVTVTIEASVTPTVNAASAIFQDITNEFFGVASETSSSIFTFDTPMSFRFIRIKIVASTGGFDDGDWRIDIKKDKVH